MLGAVFLFKTGKNDAWSLRKPTSEGFLSDRGRLKIRFVDFEK